MERLRIQVYADAEMKRRIELASIRRELSVTEYCLQAIQQRLAEEDLLERERIEIRLAPGPNSELVADLRALQGRIADRRGGRELDVDGVLDEVRGARDVELSSLR